MSEQSGSRGTLPVETWVGDAVNGGTRLYQPFPIAVGDIWDTKLRQPMGSSTPPPAMTAAMPKGAEYFERVRRDNPSKDKLHLNIFFSNAEYGRDIVDPNDPEDTRYEDIMYGASTLVLGVEGSILLQETAARDAELRGLTYRHGFMGCLMDIHTESGLSLPKSCDPNPDTEGGKLVTAVGDVVKELTTDTSDRGGAGLMADVAYVDTLRWHAAFSVGEILFDALEENGGRHSEVPAVILRPELFPIVDSFGALGMRHVSYGNFTPEAHPSGSDDVAYYCNVLSSGIMP